MGGGNDPPMEILKNWMYESYEINYNGKVVRQEVPSDEPVPIVAMNELVDYMPDTTNAHDDFEIDLHLDNMNDASFSHISHSVPTYIHGHHIMAGQYTRHM